MNIAENNIKDIRVVCLGYTLRSSVVAGATTTLVNPENLRLILLRWKLELVLVLGL